MTYNNNNNNNNNVAEVGSIRAKMTGPGLSKLFEDRSQTLKIVPGIGKWLAAGVGVDGPELDQLRQGETSAKPTQE